MAIARKTQKDVSKYEPKLLGPFTTRQCVCIGIGAVPTVIIDILLVRIGSVDPFSLFGVALILMAIPCFFGFGKRFCHGQKPEDFLRDYYFYHILAPKVRLHTVETLDDTLDAKNQKTNNSDVPKKKGNSSKEKKSQHKPDKKYPDYV